MTLKELISQKDYDYISIRYTPPKGWYPDLNFSELSSEELLKISEFMGCAKSENGILYALDHDTYDAEEEVLAFEEFVNEKENVFCGLSVAIQGHWLSEEKTPFNVLL